MTVKSIRKRLNRIGSFVAVAGSLRAVPSLVVTAVACDNAFGHEGIWSASLGRLFGTVKVRTGVTSGEYALIDTHDLGQLVSCEEILIEQIYKFSLVPFVPDLVVDCGSHIGLFSLVAALEYPEASVSAFEPAPDNVRVLRKQLARFGSRISINEAAVFDRDGESGFSVAQSNCGHLNGSDSAPKDHRFLTVRTVDLAAEAETWQEQKLLIKLDIEGAEEQVLPRLVPKLPRNTALFLEIHSQDHVRQKLCDLLTEKGFAVSLTRQSPESSDWFAFRVA